MGRDDIEALIADVDALHAVVIAQGARRSAESTAAAVLPAGTGRALHFAVADAVYDALVVVRHAASHHPRSSTCVGLLLELADVDESDDWTDAILTAAVDRGVRAFADLHGLTEATADWLSEAALAGAAQRLAVLGDESVDGLRELWRAITELPLDDSITPIVSSRTAALLATPAA